MDSERRFQNVVAGAVWTEHLLTGQWHSRVESANTPTLETNWHSVNLSANFQLASS